MAFHEVRLPTEILYESSGGPGFSTAVVEGDGGSSERISRWPRPRHQYKVKIKKTWDAINTFKDFYIARDGIAIGFRYKDWLDYSTASNHRNTPTNTDVFLGTSVGTGSQQFQLRTGYADGFGGFKYRTITKPVSGTAVLARTPSGGGAAVALTGVSVDTSTGLATVPGGQLVAGDSVTGGCEFDVPVQFGIELDALLDVVISNYDNADLAEVPLVEMLGSTAAGDRFFTGDAFTNTAALTLLQITPNYRLWVQSSSTSSTWLLPDPTDFELGTGHFDILNLSTGTITVKTFDQASTVVTLTSGVPSPKGALIGLYNDGTVNKWAAFAN